jgi:hypothetical protein
MRSLLLVESLDLCPSNHIFYSLLFSNFGWNLFKRNFSKTLDTMGNRVIGWYEVH